MTAAKFTPGPLRVTTFDATSQQARVQNDHSRVKGNWNDIYVEFSGFFGSYGPHVFAAAPELLEALIRAKRHLAVDSVEHEMAEAAIAKATGAAS